MKKSGKDFFVCYEGDNYLKKKKKQKKIFDNFKKNLYTLTLVKYVIYY